MVVYRGGCAAERDSVQGNPVLPGLYRKKKENEHELSEAFLSSANWSDGLIFSSPRATPDWIAKAMACGCFLRVGEREKKLLQRGGGGEGEIIHPRILIPICFSSSGLFSDTVIAFCASER